MNGLVRRIGWSLLAVMLGSLSGLAQTDGPATLPLRTPLTSLTSPNPTTVVSTGANLAQAVAAAQCGDSLSVQGVTWTGGFTTPSGCSATNAITIAGVNSKIILGPGQEIKLGSYVQFTGFEVTRLTGGIVYSFVGCAPGSHDQIVQHNVIHGTTTDDSVRAVDLSGCLNFAVLGNILREFHCASVVGACTDSQGVVCGFNDVAGGGNFWIEGNYIEAAGEDILCGGAYDLYVPTDITIVRNVLTKPLCWNPGDPCYVVPAQGRPYVVKNLFELKNGARVLFEGNTLSNVWGGFTQSGFAILLTPKNQAGANGTNICPVCAVTDVTVRYDTISHAGMALQLSVGPSSNGGWPADGGHWSIHDLNFFDLQYATCYQCGLTLVQITSEWGGPIVLHDLSLTHVNFSVSNWLGKYHGWLMISGPVAAPQITNVHLDYNVAPAGNMIVNAAGGGAANCIYGLSQPDKIIAACFAGSSSATGNVITTESGAPSLMSVWPAGNVITNAGADLTVVNAALAKQH